MRKNPVSWLLLASWSWTILPAASGAFLTPKFSQEGRKSFIKTMPMANPNRFSMAKEQASAATNNDTEHTTSIGDKKVVFIRHGCTYMNEYLSANPFGSPGFTDVFSEDDSKDKYRDSPLSPRGVLQAETLASRLADSSCPEYGNLLEELDLIVVSPLTRAIQTLEIGLLPHIQSAVSDHNDDDQQDSPRPAIPIVALPHAAERLYLISDVGRTRRELHGKYGHWIDFYSEIPHDDEWWFRPPSTAHDTEWRPNSNQQRYACPGEPDESFGARMTQLCQWLDDRPESTIALISHWGVIDHFLNADFDNCEMCAVPLSQLKQRVAQRVSSG